MTILCFGDSNTWGFIPGTSMRRLPKEARWPGVMAARLGPDVQVIEDGLCGRTTAWDDPLMLHRNGHKHLRISLEVNAPIDQVILMLGTNDLKHYFGFLAEDIALGVGFLVNHIQASGAGPVGHDPWTQAPDILLVSPPRVVKSPNPFGHKFDNAVEKSARLAPAFQEIASEYGVDFFDAATVAEPPPTDGIHLDRAGHLSLGEALALCLRPEK